MRFHTTAVLRAAATAPALSAANRGSLGFALGSKQPSGDCKTQDDYGADLDAIDADSGAKVVRIYAASQCNTTREIMPAAKS
jgi:exo-beta-1,3-glucanase (GH17 family)